MQQVVAVRPDCCTQCHELLRSSSPPIYLPRCQQVWELPEVAPVVTEYQLHNLCYPGYGDLITATHPLDAPTGAFRPWVIDLIALLHGPYRISHYDWVPLPQMVWQLPISLDSVVGLQQVAIAMPAGAPARQDLHGYRQFRPLLRAQHSLPSERQQRCWVRLVRNLRGRPEVRCLWQADSFAMQWIAEEVLIVWAMYRDGALTKEIMEGRLRAYQQVLWGPVTAGQHQHHYVSGSLCCNLMPCWDVL